jgi:hypothetical protein
MPSHHRLRITALASLPCRYAGEVMKSQAHGVGVTMTNNGVYYEGQFKEGQRHGVGIITWANGERYIGEFKHGKREGDTITMRNVELRITIGVG